MDIIKQLFVQATDQLDVIHASLPSQVHDILSILDNLIIKGWTTIVDNTGGETYAYIRLCVLPSLGSVVLFWALNVPLLVWNFYPAFNPLERWKVQKGRYETFSRVCWMVLTVLVNQGIGMAISLKTFFRLFVVVVF